MSRLLTTLRSYWTGTFQSRDPLLASELGYGPTSTGVSVTPESAFNSSAFWSAVSIIAADVASLPLELFKRSKDGSTSAFTDSKTYELVHDNPNPEMTSMVWRETLQAHALTWGGGYSEIERNGGGQPIALWPLTPDRVVPFRNAGRVQYRVANTNQPDTILEAYDILHVPGLGFNGLIGYSVLEKARESISMGLAMQRFGGSFFGNGSTFGGILSHPGKLTKEVKQGIRESIDAVHTGVDRAHKFVILGDGMTFAKLGIPPNDAQFLESRRFEIEEIARWFHMPQHKLNGLDHATFSNIEHLDLEYFKSCLRGWLVRWEQELNRKLVPSLERKTQYFKHNVEGFLRGDSAARADYQVKMFGIGGLSINQICELNDQNGIGPDGDARFVPANLMPVARALNPPTPPPPPVAQPPADGAVDEAKTRAAEAEQAAIEARAEADREHAIRVAAETTEAQSAEEIVRLLAAEDAAVKRAAEATNEAAVLRETATTLQQAHDAAVAARDEAVARALASESTVTDIQARAETLKAEHQAALVTAEREREIAARALADAEAAVRDRTTAESVTVAETTAHIEQLREHAREVRAELAQREEQLTAAQAALSLATEQATADAAARALAETARTAAEAAIETQRAAEHTRLVGMVAAHRGLIVDAMGRMVRRETEKARRHQATPAKLRAWADVFYVGHEDICLEALRPAIRAHLAWKQSADDVDTVTSSFVRDHIAESVRQLQTVLEGHDGDELPAVLDRMLTRWEQQRPDAFADRILREEVEYVTQR
jgi:HK97 family phage portal protein